MCGRYALTSPSAAIARLFGARSAGVDFPARYNAAPGQGLPVVRRDENGTRVLDLLNWGLVPAWSKGPDSRFSMINARAETVAEKPAFRGPFRYRRCLVPASGFFEWQKTAKGKQPWYFSPADGGLMAFAGLWDWWQGADGSEILSFAIVVTDADALVRPVHDRMPVILSPQDHPLWLGEKGDASPAELKDLLRPFPADRLTKIPVSRRVNAPSNDDPELLDPVPVDGELF